MSPGIQTITRMNLPLEVLDRDLVCPACRRPLVIEAIDMWHADGHVPVAGLQIDCSTRPSMESRKWAGWHKQHYQPGIDWERVQAEVGKWFNAFFRYQHIEPEVAAEIVTKRRRLKWRRAA